MSWHKGDKGGQKEDSQLMGQRRVLEEATSPFGASVTFSLLKFKTLISKCLQLENLKETSSCIEVFVCLFLFSCFFKLLNTTILFGHYLVG